MFEHKFNLKLKKLVFSYVLFKKTGRKKLVVHPEQVRIIDARTFDLQK